MATKAEKPSAKDKTSSATKLAAPSTPKVAAVKSTAAQATTAVKDKATTQVKAPIVTGHKVAKSISKTLHTATKAVAKRKETDKAADQTPEVGQGGKIASSAVATPKKAPKARIASPRHFIVDLLLERKHTDEEILSKVVEKFGDGLYTTKKAYIQLTRADLNSGLIKEPIVDGRMTTFVGKVVVDETSKQKVELPYKPSALRKTGFQFKLTA